MMPMTSSMNTAWNRSVSRPVETVPNSAFASPDRSVSVNPSVMPMRVYRRNQPATTL